MEHHPLANLQMPQPQIQGKQRTARAGAVWSAPSPGRELKLLLGCCPGSLGSRKWAIQKLVDAGKDVSGIHAMPGATQAGGH